MTSLAGWLGKKVNKANPWTFKYIDWLMASTACLVCFISTVNGQSKKRKEAYQDWRISHTFANLNCTDPSCNNALLQKIMIVRSLQKLDSLPKKMGKFYITSHVSILLHFNYNDYTLKAGVIKD